MAVRFSELSPNQIVAYNVERLRRERGWTAVETARRWGALLGRKISLASYSAMERSVEGRRIKSFDADEIFSLARLFGVRVWFLFIPPINFRLHPVRVRPKGAPVSQSLARTAAEALVVETPENIFADMAAFAAGERMEPEPANSSLSLSDPIDVAVLQLVVQMMKQPLPTSGPEQQKQSEELVSLMKEIYQARQKRSDAQHRRDKAR